MSVCPPQGPEAREWVATEIMGWVKAEGFRVDDNDFEVFSVEDFADAEAPFRPDDDLNHSAMMEKKIEEMGKEHEYTAALALLLAVQSIPMSDQPMWWRLIRATPYERVQAAWKMMNG